MIMWCGKCGKFGGDHADFCERKSDPLPVESPAAGSVSLSRIDKIGADRLAYECARQVLANNIDSRSGIGDALLDYLRVGHCGGPESVPEWIEEYEKRLKSA